MARRRRKTSTVEDLIEVASRFPWWVSVLLASISFLILHTIAGIRPTHPTGVGDMGSHVAKQLYVTLAFFGQIILPFVFGLAALTSLLRARGQKPAAKMDDFQLPKGESFNLSIPEKPQEWSLETLKSLEWKRFETVCTEYLKLIGYDPKETKIGADGGVDIWVYKNGADKPIGIIQCKAWTTYKVGVKPVRELFGVMAAEGVRQGKFITSGEFTTEARQFAEGKKLQLVSGESFLRIIKKLPLEDQKKLLNLALDGDYQTPTCPQCGTKMKLRQGKTEASRKFWGCPRFPKCRATLVYKEA